MKRSLLLGALFFLAVNAGIPSPIKGIYIDWRNINWSQPQQTVTDAVNAGFNLVILSFYLSGSGPTDMAQAWAGVSPSDQQAAIQQAHQKGAIVTVSLGGSTDSPYSHDAFSLGEKVATWALQNNLDGVDFDLENFEPGFQVPGLSPQQTIDWVGNVTMGARKVLGSNGYISHAPQAPYFGPIGNSSWVGPLGGYSQVYQQTNGAIDFFNVQFYNQGSSCYVDFQGTFYRSCSGFPYTSVDEIARTGVPLNKILLGKPVTPADAGSGYVAPSTLNSWISQASNQLGWRAGVFGWEWQDASTCSSWINTIY